MGIVIFDFEIFAKMILRWIVCAFMFHPCWVDSQVVEERKITVDDLYSYILDEAKLSIKDMIYDAATKTVLATGSIKMKISAQDREGPLRMAVLLDNAISKTSRELKGDGAILDEKPGVSDITVISRMFDVDNVVYTSKLILACGKTGNWIQRPSFLGYKWNLPSQHVAGVFNVPGEKKVLVYFDTKKGELRFDAIDKQGKVEDSGKKPYGNIKYNNFKNFYFQVCPDPGKNGHFYMILVNSDGIENVQMDLFEFDFSDVSFKDNSFFVKQTFLNPPVLAEMLGKEGLVKSNSTSLGIGVGKNVVPCKSPVMLGLDNFEPDNGELKFNAKGNLVWYFHSPPKTETNTPGSVIMAEISPQGSLISMNKIHGFLPEDENGSLSQKAFSRYLGHSKMGTIYFWQYSEDIIETHLFIKDINTGKDRILKFNISRKMLATYFKKFIGDSIKEFYNPSISNMQVILTGPNSGFIALNVVYSFKIVNLAYESKEVFYSRSGAVFIPFNL